MQTRKCRALIRTIRTKDDAAVLKLYLLRYVVTYETQQGRAVELRDPKANVDSLIMPAQDCLFLS